MRSQASEDPPKEKLREGELQKEEHTEIGEENTITERGVRIWPRILRLE